MRQSLEVIKNMKKKAGGDYEKYIPRAPGDVLWDLVQ
jgi:hypothetical protein